jgi:spermidine synthase
MILHPDPKDALVVGLGSGMTTGAVEQYEGLRSVTVVELEPEVVEAASYFSDITNNALQDPRLEVVVGDGRNYLLTTSKTFDVITVQPSNVWVRGMAYLFTKEYFELAKKRLKPEGVMAQWIFINVLTESDLKSFLATFQSVFPHTTVWADTQFSGILLVGSGSPLDVDITVLEEKMAREKIKKDLELIGISDLTSLFGYFIMDEEAVRTFSQNATLHTDNRPFLEFSAPRALYSMDNARGNLGAIQEFRSHATTLLDGEKVSAQDQEALETLFEWRSKVMHLALFESAGPESLSLLEEIFALHPRNRVIQDTLIKTYFSKAEFLRTQKERKKELQETYDAMVSVYQAILALEGDYGYAYRGLVGVYMQSERLFEAERELKKTLFQNEQDAWSHNRLARVYILGGRQQFAEPEFLRALELDPKNYEFVNDLANFYRAQGEIEKTLEAFEKSLELNPNQKEVKEIIQIMRNKMNI